MNVIDFKPIIDGVVVPLLGAALTAVGAWGVRELVKVAHLTITQQQGAILEAAMQRGIDFALSKAQEYADKHGQVPVKSDVIAEAVNYVLPKVPQAVAHLGVTPAGLAQRIEARLPPVGGVINVTNPRAG